jgi:pimeloyl-ACP methyl ester carboxylesterase
MPTLHLQDIRGDWANRPFFGENGFNSNSSGEKGINAHAAAPAPPPPRNNPQSTHPILEEAMRDLTGDVVILGGYRGSILRSAKPPHRQLWVPMKVGLNLRKVDLEVGLNREDEERMEETIIPSGVLSHVGPVDVCRRLMKRLRKCDNAIRGDMRVWDYGYDWRLSPDLLSKRLIEFLERLPCNRGSSDGQNINRRGATVIAHSLGGLITRHAVNQRPDLFAGVVYAGVPQHCVNILGPLRNGDDVLLSSRVLTAQVNFTFRTSFALLPEDGHCFIDKQSKEEFRIDFFDPKSWEEHRLSPCCGPALPAAGSRGFKDFAGISKRFSFGARDELNLNESDMDASTNTSTEDINSRRIGHLPHSSTAPVNASSSETVGDKVDKAQEKVGDALNPGVDGLVGPNPNPRGSAGASKASTTVTIPHHVATEYLTRVLAEVKRFKYELDFQPAHQMTNRYPPTAVLYGKSVPTVYGARVTSREAIKRTDCYDDLAFAAGDGVCLASAAMLPPGYRVIKHGLVKSDRGHVGLLGDLEGVGQCLRAIIRGRKEGVGMGNSKS